MVVIERSAREYSLSQNHSRRERFVIFPFPAILGLEPENCVVFPSSMLDHQSSLPQAQSRDTPELRHGMDRPAVIETVREQLDALDVPQIQEWSVSISHNRRVRVTAVISERLPEEDFSRLKETLKDALSPLKVQIRTVRSHGLEPDNFQRKSQAEARYERDLLYRDANKTLPVGIELLRVHRYQIPLSGGTLDFAVMRMHVAEGKENTVREWQESFERRHKIEVFIERAEANESLAAHLTGLNGGSGLITGQHLPGVRELINGIATEPSDGKEVAARAVLPAHLPDLRQMRFLTIDPLSTRDMEDALHVERLPNGDTRLRVAFIDITWFLEPRSALELHAQKIGATIYGTKKNIPTLGSDVATTLASFNPHEDRVAWVLDFLVHKNGRTELQGKPFRALLRSHERLSPEQVDSLLQCKNPAVPELALLRETASRMLAYRLQGQGIIRIKGEGAANQIVAEAAVAGKRTLGEYLAQEKDFPAIFKVHATPSLGVQLSLLRELKVLGISGSARIFAEPLEFAATLQEVQDITLNSEPGTEQFQRATELMQKILDIFLTRSRFDLNNIGHHALGVAAYLEIKPRDASGITNQFQLKAACEGGAGKFSREEVKERAENRNRLLKSYDWNCYELRFLEMLSEKLALAGQEFSAKVTRLRRDSVYIDVPGFSKWGFAEVNVSTMSLGDKINVRLLGFNTQSMRFMFEILPGTKGHCWPK